MSNGSSEVKVMSADGGALGLFSLALVTLVGSAQFFGQADPPQVAWILCLAAFAQIWAAMIGFKSNNIFGGTVFGAYGLFWFGMGVNGLLANGVFGVNSAALTSAGGVELQFVCIGYLIFSILMTIAAGWTNKLLVIVLALITLLFFGLTLVTSGIAGAKVIADLSRFVLSIVCFYAVAAIVINTLAGKSILPVGAK